MVKDVVERFVSESSLSVDKRLDALYEIISNKVYATNYTKEERIAACSLLLEILIQELK